MLTSHCLSLLGVPMSKVMRYTREARKDGYRILRGFFHGQNRALFDQPERFREQLKTVVLVEGAYAVDRALEELGLDQFRVSVTAIRRKSIRVPDPAPEVILRNADVLVLFGAPEDLERAESVVLSGIS
jgi:CPA2 family monovalent cation:H+ antiporter-2